MTAERVFLKSTRGGPKLKMLYIYFRLKCYMFMEGLFQHDEESEMLGSELVNSSYHLSKDATFDHTT